MDEIYFHESKQPVFNINDEIYYSEERKPKKKVNSKRNMIACGIAIALAIFLIGLGLGFWTCNLKRTIDHDEHSEVDNKWRKLVVSHDDIAEGIVSREIEEHLRQFTKYPHSAGSLRNRELAMYIKNKWQNEYGIESELNSYNVLLSFPSKEKRSAVHLIDSQNKVMFTTQYTEKAVEESEKQENVLPPFAAYSPSGNVTAEMIYVNYGRAEDFQYLQKHNVSAKGKIVIVRYGENFRGDKVRLAHDHGALGVIVYNDPADFAPVPETDTYPRSKYLPCTGVQRGAFRAANGDPETPGYPSKAGIYRVTKRKQSLPKIPVYPISACDALPFLRKLNKDIRTPEAWQGGLNVSYHIGPGFRHTYKSWKVRLEVYNEEERKDIYNVVGTIRGEKEPDRRVMIGNHRDAWVFGGVDPSGGTACLMEIGRALGRAMKTGWRPRRTIMLFSWGGEEYGMIGSTEYAEEFSQLLREEGVTYLNIDSPVRGNYSLFAKSSPMLYDVLFGAAKKVKNPANKHESVFDQWLRNLPSTESYPRVENIATGSDYVAFNQQLGIPSAEIRYIASKDNFGFPAYHSIHDTFHYVKHFMDPEFHIHRAIAQVITYSVLALADNKILPMNASRFAEKLSFGVKDLIENHGEALMKYNITIEYLVHAVEEFTRATVELEEKIRNVQEQNEILKIRMLNDKLVMLEKGFISGNHAFGSQKTRHVIFGLNSQNSYKTVQFPGLFNALMKETKNESEIKEQMNILITHIQSVANYLKLL